MNLETGMVLEGKVTGITKFGAFVEIEPGKTGMVHISEVAPTFVNDIREYLEEGQKVKVKVLSISDDGKISLSIKKAAVQNDNNNNQRPNRSNQQYRSQKPNNNNNNNSYEWQQPKRSESSSFEDMMSKFKQTSEEKMSDLKRMNENKRGSYPRRSNSQKP